MFILILLLHPTLKSPYQSKHKHIFQPIHDKNKPKSTLPQTRPPPPPTSVTSEEPLTTIKEHENQILSLCTLFTCIFGKRSQALIHLKDQARKSHGQFQCKTL